ncbi:MULTISPECIES: long-chain fatty acid--CoA ligase [Halobacterium]|uniref:AMP-dependent synthetase/ligase n=1 Tax=Halobacterium TaxID=2239 RepID=UPI00073EEA57|nr:MULTISPECIES: long-chain fatty acid--CoA ligase [Halobacterium]MCG1004159.1 long-chain fatty acid--CoA ligase [Halobacterium noricense]
MNFREAERDYEDEVTGQTTLARMFEDAAERHADRPAQGYKGGVYDRTLTPDVLPPAPDGEFADITYSEMRDIVRNLAAGFRDLGVEAGERVGIFAHTRMEWAQCDFGALAAGAAVTTVYSSSSSRQVKHLLGDSDAVGVVVEGETELERVREAEADLDLEFVVTMDRVADDDAIPLSDVYERGREAFDRDTYESWIDAADYDDLASLIYTSGTTGKPKGVALTHENFRENVNQCRKRFGPRPDKDGRPAITAETRVVSFLPLAHVLERLSGHFLLFASGAHVCYAESSDTLREDFSLCEPSVGTSVPRVYEKIYAAVREQAAESPTKERIFEWATDVGREVYETDDPGLVLRAKHAVADKLVFQQVRDALGGNIDFFISGGGSLSPELCALYHGMGLPILEGYGLTETSPVVCVNPLEAPQTGTIGPPVVGTEVRVDETIASPEQRAATDGAAGELLVRGPQVFDGYWGLDDATEQAFTEIEGREWFRTGDVVELHDDDYVRFLERAKQILTLSTGKNVAPGPIEDAFAASALVEQAMVVGDNRKFVSAVIVPDFGAIRKWAESEGIDLPEDKAGVCRNGRVEARIQQEVDAVNENFEDYEQIKRFRLVPTEFTEDNDLLTPTMKKKRRNILDAFADEIGDIYAE